MTWCQETIEAVEKVNRNADVEWKDAAYDCVVEVAKSKAEFTADDVMERVELLPVKTHNLRAFGPVMVKAVKNHIAEQTPMAVPSRRKSRHNCPIRVWKSLIFEAQ